LPIKGNLKRKHNFTCNMKEQPIDILLFLSQSRKSVKVTLKAQYGVDYSSTFFNLGGRRGGLSTHALTALPWERPGPHCIGGRVGSRANLDRYGKSHPTKIRSPDHPACSKLLYQLRNLSPHYKAA
jgi:hypothetical protein